MQRISVVILAIASIVAIIGVVWVVFWSGDLVTRAIIAIQPNTAQHP